jgi:hypothetical protein
VLPPAQRTLGNSILQSGAAVGAVITPLVVRALLAHGDAAVYPAWVTGLVGTTAGQVQVAAPPTTAVMPWLLPVVQPGAWRTPFLLIGAVGLTWALLWGLSVRRGNLTVPPRTEGPSLMSLLGVLILLLGLDVGVQLFARYGGVIHLSPGESSPWWLSLPTKVVVCGISITLVVRWLFRATAGDDRLPRPLFARRFVVVCVAVIALNLTWHFFRVWLPLFLQKEHHYTEAFTNDFFMAYYFAAGVGSLVAGSAALLLAHRGVAVHTSRVIVYLICAALCCLSIAAAVLPSGYLLLGVLLVIGFAALGLFPLYYSFTQELTVRHQGKLSGALGCITWLASYLLHEVVGITVKATGSNTVGVALAGLLPLLAIPPLLMLWGKDPWTAAPPA